MRMVGSYGGHRWLVVCVDIVDKRGRRWEWRQEPVGSTPWLGGMRKGVHVLRRGNPSADPALVPEGWINIVLLRHAESSNRDSARDFGKRRRASRGIVRLERWTSWTNPPRQREGV